MSFILDALRKSETERQKKAAPGLVDTHYKTEQKRRNIWLPLLVLILAINAAVITVLLLNDSSEDAEVGVTDSTPPSTAMKSVQRPEPRTTTEPEVRPLYREAAAPKKVTEAAETEAKPAGDEPQTVALAASEPPESVDEVLPSLQQLSAAGLVSLPTLHVDIHVYSSEPDQRFVFVNMNKYREGETLKEGPRIETITETGAVLSHQGNRFTLERE